MPGLLTVPQFIDRMMGKPWVRWRSDFDACDCFGLLVLYHREVLGIELGPVPQTDIATGFSEADGWLECERTEHAACFMSWFDGAPTHCGIVLAGAKLLHCEGSDEHPGSVRVSRLDAVELLYGTLKYYRFTC